MPYDNTNNSMQKLAEAYYAVTAKYQTANTSWIPKNTYPTRLKLNTKVDGMKAVISIMQCTVKD